MATGVSAHRTVIIDVTLSLPREAETVTIIRRVLGQALETIGVTLDCVDDIRLALSEACTNVIDHAAADDQYEVALHVDADECAISVRNQHNEFEPDGLGDAMPDSGSQRGRGVAIMRAVMDSVDFRSQPEAGTLVHLVKHIDVEPDTLLARLRAT